MENRQNTRRLRRYQVYVADETGRIIPNGYIGYVEDWDLTAEGAIKQRLSFREGVDRIRKVKSEFSNVYRVHFLGSGPGNYRATIVR